MREVVQLGNLDLALASLLVLLAGGLSLALRLGVTAQLFIAALRMLVQLSLMGLVLKTLFTLVSPWLTALAAAVMLLFAGREVMGRQTRPLKGLWTYGLGTGAMTLAATLVTVLALSVTLRADPWYHPAYALPLLGMVLGNCMTGTALALERLTEGAAKERAAIEARLALGHDRVRAFSSVVRQAVRAGIMPVVNAMSAMGLVFLPGMLTGQILAGQPAEQAVRYQILVMFLIAGGTALGVLSITLAAAARLTDGRHRLRLDRLKTPEGG